MSGHTALHEAVRFNQMGLAILLQVSECSRVPVSKHVAERQHLHHTPWLICHVTCKYVSIDSEASYHPTCTTIRGQAYTLHLWAYAYVWPHAYV